MRRSGLRPSLLFSLIAATLLVGACLNPIMDPPLSYVLRFDANGGVGVADAPYDQDFTLVLVGDRIDLPGPGTMSNLPEVFLGWNTRPSGAGIFYAPGDAMTMPSHDVTLHAVWGPGGATFTITYNANGADSGTVPVEQTKIEGVDLTLASNTGGLVRSEFTFTGWNTQADGSGTFFAEGESYTDNANLTLYAEWTPNTYFVFFEPDEGTGIMAPVEVDFQEWIVLPPSTFTRDGFTFNGWAVVPAGPIIYINEANYQHVTVGDQTLYALWIPEPEFAGGVGTAVDPYQVATANHLNNVRNHLGATFAQTANIDLGVSPWNEGDGWEPIGTDATPFTGSYDGGGFTISGLTINRSEDNVGLFGRINGATIERVGLEDVSVSGLINTGALVGSSAITSSSLVRDSYAIGTVDSTSYHTGGLIGFAGEMTVERSFAAVAVTSTVASPSNRVGGLIGRSSSVTVNDSYAVGSVTTTGTEGFIGGLLGGGVGTTINRSYAAGRITTAGATAGGLVGDGGGVNVTDSFFDTYTTGIATGIGLPRPTASMLRQSNFNFWNFLPGGTWAIDGDVSYPYLQWYSGPAPVPATAFALRDVGPAGGWVFYDKGFYSDGWRYMEAAPADASTGIGWGGSGTLVDLTSTEVGTGLENTDHIISILGAGSYAAELARSQNIAGFTDWFLPSDDELHLMYLNLHAESVGGFATANHWSSTAGASDLYAIAHYFNPSGAFVTLRSNSFRVRPARRF